MSRHARKRRRELRDLKVKELDYFGPQPVRRDSLASQLENWILFGEGDGQDIMHSLFPIPGNGRGQ